MTAAKSPPASQRLTPSQPPRTRKGASPRLPVSTYVTPEAVKARYRKTVQDMEAADHPKVIKKNKKTSKGIEAADNTTPPKKANKKNSKGIEAADNTTPPKKANNVYTK